MTLVHASTGLHDTRLVTPIASLDGWHYNRRRTRSRSLGFPFGSPPAFSEFLFATMSADGVIDLKTATLAQLECEINRRLGGTAADQTHR